MMLRVNLLQQMSKGVRDSIHWENPEAKTRESYGNTWDKPALTAFLHVELLMAQRGQQPMPGETGWWPHPPSPTMNSDVSLS